MPGPLRNLCLVPLILGLAATSALAQEARGFTCTNIMGGNPYRLTIFESGLYIIAPFEGTVLPTSMGEGQLELGDNPIYYTVISGPLLDELKVDKIHIMSPTRLSPSGSAGLFDCTKAK